MGYYTVWVVGPSPLEIVEQFDESNDIPGSFPGLTFDFIADTEEPGPASYFSALPDEDYPSAIVTATGQIIDAPHPGSEPDASVAEGIDRMREFLEGHLEEKITPMTWHT